jgi:hypothetical protein
LSIAVPKIIRYVAGKKISELWVACANLYCRNAEF